MSRVYLAGSGWFGRAAAERLTEHGHTIVAVCSPTEGRHQKVDQLAGWAERTETPWQDVTRLTPETIPDHTDVILAAHSHAFIGRRTRARAPYALGYHPSMLPLHRGRDAVKWQARMGDRIVGGTIYHLTDRVDGGPIAYQQALVVPAGTDARTLWADYLAPLGLDLLTRAADNATGLIPTRPQDDTLATWEPSFNTAPVYRPELLEIEA